jgi:5-methylcytosine-specific restriction enzyme A
LCPNLVESGRCPDHQRQVEQRRGSSAARGYGSTWRAFRDWFKNRLIVLGIAPVCGAALPGGPAMTWSQCKALGILNDRNLNLDHEPPLRPDERSNRRAIEDPLRVGFLCPECHSRKTLAEQRA